MSETAQPTLEGTRDPLSAGREALSRRAWQEAFDLLSEADRTTQLGGPDLEALADAAFFAARPDVRIEAKERAHAAYLAADDPVRAAYLAFDLATELGQHGRTSMASAWARRGERLLDGRPETYAHAYLELTRSRLAGEANDVEGAIRHATRALEIAGRAGNRDLHAAALGQLALLKVATGDTAEGFGLLEEAAIAAVNGELSPIIAGITSCAMISACRDLTDYSRAREWLEATDRWCERQSVSAFPGICRVHRAEILALQGGWERAEQELRKATNDLAAYDAVPVMADGLYALGEIRRLRGDYEGAEEALRQAHALGRTPQPALALIRAGQGNVRAAATAIEAALSEATWDQWARARLLAAQVEIAIADGDVPTARAAADELSAIVEHYPVPALDAGRHLALGRVLLAEGDAAPAATELRAAIRLWREVGAPYEVARARADLGAALRAVGDEEDAELELRAARDEFERLGARPDLAAAEAALAAIAARRSGPVHVRLTFMFTDIEGSTTLAETLGDVAWERLLAWHDETLRGLIARAGGSVVNSTGDGFFAAFEEPSVALDCAVAIQRALAAGNPSGSPAPRVRIGVHTADATQRGADYSGIGVHVAARIAALAAGGEILASRETLAEADRQAVAEREVRVRGVSSPVRVAAVVWT